MSIDESFILVAATFLLAGWVKGVVGMGLPTVAMGILSLLMEPVQAAALLVLPSLVTNIWQYLSGPAARGIARRLATLLLMMCVGTAVGIHFLTSELDWVSGASGAVLAVYGVLGLYLPKLAIAMRHEAVASPVVGLLTGVISGATGIFVIPAVPYLSALRISKDELIQALGLSFTVSTIAQREMIWMEAPATHSRRLPGNHKL